MMVEASDYKPWVPLLPETLGGLQRSEKPQGFTMEMGEESWSSLHQAYSMEDGEKSIDLTLVLGKGSPHMANFEMMSAMKIETEEQIIKTTQIKNRKALLSLEKEEKRASLMIPLGKGMMVVLEATPIMKEEEIIALAEELPLDQFAAKAE
jgi:hypothetical protein